MNLSNAEMPPKIEKKHQGYIEKLREENPNFVEEYKPGEFRPTAEGWKNINLKAEKFEEEARKLESEIAQAYRRGKNPLPEIRKKWPHGKVSFAFSPRDQWGMYFGAEGAELIPIPPNLKEYEVKIIANSMGDIMVVLGTKQSEGTDFEK